MHQNQNKNKQHKPVMLGEVLKYLAPKLGESYLDLTAGYGGHAKAITAITGSLIPTVLIDRDQKAVNYLEQIFSSGNIEIQKKDFLTASQEFVQQHRQFDLILADLGVSSPHLNEGDRGFSYALSGSLDMRMDQMQKLDAATILNSYSEKQLIDILNRYGQEPKARTIAKAIIQARPLKTTDELALIAQKAWPGYSRKNPASRTFQAIRIAVNDELNQLEKSLPLWFDLLKPGGRIVVISFHSLEDRMVKQAMKSVSHKTYEASFSLLTKHAIKASPYEIVHNPRSRSAKLRAAVKIKMKGN